MAGKKNGRRPEDYSVHIDIRVRFRDLDPFGHLNNGVYLSLFEEARLAYAKRLEIPEEHTGENVLQTLTDLLPMYVVKADMEFRSQAYLHQCIRICTSIVSVRKSFLEFNYGIFDRDSSTYIGGGRTTLIALDPESAQPMRINNKIIAAIEHIEGRSITNMENENK